MLPQSLTLVIALMLCLGLASANTGLPIKPLELPAPQTSVSSTAFNPAETNPGGTTNSAGTFDVVSLSASTSYAFDSNIPVTTSFVITSPNIAASPSLSTPAYLTGGDASSASLKMTSGPSVSLASSVSVVAATSITGKSDGAIILAPFQHSWTLLLSGAAAVVGAAIVL